MIHGIATQIRRLPVSQLLLIAAVRRNGSMFINLFNVFNVLCYVIATTLQAIVYLFLTPTYETKSKRLRLVAAFK